MAASQDTAETLEKNYGRYPSSVARSASALEKENKTFWGTLKSSVINGTLVAVGLKPTRDEFRHWELMKAFASEEDDTDDTLTSKQANAQQKPVPSSPMIESDSAPSISYTPSLLMRQLTKQSLGPEQAMSVRDFKQNKATGRNQAVNTNLRPDLWKVVYDSVKTLSKKPQVREMPVGKVSFHLGNDDSDKEEDEPDGVPLSPLSRLPMGSIMEDDELFFDHEVVPHDETDSAPLPSASFRPAAAKRLNSLNIKIKPDSAPEEEESTKEGRGARLKKLWGKATLSGGYLDGYGGLGGVTKLLRFNYKKIPKKRQELLDARFLHKRPYFTYWLMLVHVIIMILALSVFGFASYGFDLREVRAFVRQTDLSLAPTSKLVVQSAWGGPPQQALVVLGALFAPCMRSDRQIIRGIVKDRDTENQTSGCCVHRDGSGCFQADPTACLPRFSDFHYEGNDSTRAVCGTSPNTCQEPSPSFSAGIWQPQVILTWPICFLDINSNSTEPHLTCEVTSRPCCYGTQAICLITTPDHCSFLNGRSHQDAFLCSQVDCLNDICGLLPFTEFNEPDQFYRLWLALFLHAGLIHLFLSLLFSFFVLRHVEKRLGWLRTAVIYVLSGIGGNLVSAYLTPYNPEVGPAGSIMGIVAYFFVFLIFESRLLEHKWQEFLKLLGVVVVFLLMGLLPFIDNMAHVGGFIFGFLVSGVIVPFNPYKQYWSVTKQDPRVNDVFLFVKVGLIIGGLVGLVLLFVLFFVLLYVVQTTWIGFSFFTCIPLTSTLCLDQQDFIRNRTQFIV